MYNSRRETNFVSAPVNFSALSVASAALRFVFPTLRGASSALPGVTGGPAFSRVASRALPPRPWQFSPSAM